MRRFLQNGFFALFMIIVGSVQSQTFLQEAEVQLSPPMITSDGVIFDRFKYVRMAQNYPESEVRFTMDGSEPTRESRKYKSPIKVKKSTEIKAKAFHPNCRASDMSTLSLIKTSRKEFVSSISLNKEPHVNYKGGGAPCLIDRQKGTMNFRSDAWLGFEGGVLNIRVELKRKTRLKNITVSLLSEPNAWIFLPEYVQVFGMSDGRTFESMNISYIPKPDEVKSTGFHFVKVKTGRRKVDQISVVIRSMAEIPKWHAGKGSPPWLFIDEVIVE